MTASERARKLLEGVTPGPWAMAGVRHTGTLKLGKDARLHFVGPDDAAVAAVFFDMKTGLGFRDAKFIAAARDLVPELLDEIEALKAKMHEVQK